MKRLTIRNSDGTVSLPASTTVEAVLYRLADYEDIDLEPEEIDSFYIHEVLSENKALRAQQEREKKEPLTLEELRGMVGEPVWCSDMQCYGIVKLETVGDWANVLFLIGSWHNFRYGTSDDFEYNIERRGLTIYRRKPEPVSTVSVDSKPKTNADRIRAMSDEELARLLVYNSVCDIVQEDLLCNGKKTCKDCIADWLQQPAEGRENENPGSL